MNYPWDRIGGKNYLNKLFKIYEQVFKTKGISFYNHSSESRYSSRSQGNPITLYFASCGVTIHHIPKVH